MASVDNCVPFLYSFSWLFFFSITMDFKLNNCWLLVDDEEIQLNQISCLNGVVNKWIHVVCIWIMAFCISQWHWFWKDLFMTYHMEKIDVQHNTKDCNNEIINWFRLHLETVYGLNHEYQLCLLLRLHKNLALHCSDLLSKIKNTHNHDHISNWWCFYNVSNQSKHTLSENVSKKLRPTVSLSPTGINGIMASWLSYW